MVNQKQLEIVKATTPVVGANVNKITNCFYATLFENDPAALGFFNEANQQRGMQQEALAAAVVAYATNIDNLAALGPAVEKIAHRHVALSVTPPLYAIVHRNLMKSIGTVLGEAVTPEIGDAWSTAVLDLAGVLIGAEEDLYEKYRKRKGGWRGEREFELVEKKTVAVDTVSFKFKATDGYTGAFEFTPGQYLTIRIPELGAAPRHYTVTSSPGDTFLECTTRKVERGQVSTYMHSEMSEGTKVLLGVPCGVFTAKKNPKGHVLVSAGIGVTPMRALAKQLGNEVKAVWTLNPSEDRCPFFEEFQKSGVPVTALTSQGGRPDLVAHAARLVTEAGLDATYYICGPPSFMSHFSHALYKAGVASGNVEMEVFGTGSIETMSKAVCPVAGKKSSDEQKKMAQEEKKDTGVKTVELGSTGLKVSEIAFGCMGITAFYGAPMDDEDALKLLKGVYDAGCTHFDTAEIYRTDLPKPPTETTKWNEVIVGKFLQTVPRESFTVATKFNPMVWPDTSAESVKKSCEASLARLGLECVDLFYLHRCPSLAVVKEWMAGAKELVKAGKVKHIGLSEVSGTWLRAAHAIHPVACVQQEWSLLTRSLEEKLVPVCAELGVGIVAYSPLARNMLAKKVHETPKDWRGMLPRYAEENLKKNTEIFEQIEAMAQKKDKSTAQLSLMWLVAKGKQLGVTCVPIPGTTKLTHALNNLQATSGEVMSAAELEKMEEAASQVAGARGYADYMKSAIETHEAGEE